MQVLQCIAANMLQARLSCALRLQIGLTGLPLDQEQVTRSLLKQYSEPSIEASSCM